jgi:hypothetical protein
MTFGLKSTVIYQGQPLETNIPLPSIAGASDPIKDLSTGKDLFGSGEVPKARKKVDL